MNVTAVWQGPVDATMQNQGSVLNWTPTLGSNYFIMAQATVACGGDNTRGVVFDVVDTDGNTVLLYPDPENPQPDQSPANSNGPQSSQAKYADGSPGTVPIVFLTWQVPADWQSGALAYITVNPNKPPSAGSNSTLTNCYYSITVIEVDGLPDR